MNTAANRLRIILVEGPVGFTADYTNALLARQGPECRVIDIEYNYQAPEVNDKGEMVAPGYHGILLALTGYEEEAPPEPTHKRRSPKAVEIRSRRA